MIDVKLTYPDWPIQRQTPNHIGVWGNCRFVCNSDIERCDYWVVFDRLSKKRDSVICPKENTLLITGEPPTIKAYKTEFLSQFSAVITCHANIHHANCIIQATGLPWHVGRRQKEHYNISFSKDYDELRSITDINKSKLISVISSAKDFSEGHLKRLSFSKRLKEHFGVSIDLFGRGLNEIEDKWDALAPYKYHVALENSFVNDYWTEKLSDAFLAGCYPIYYGAPNINKYFCMESLSQIDIDQPDKAIETIEDCIQFNKYEMAKEFIWQSREKVLEQYNLFGIITDYIDKREKQQRSNELNYRRLTLKKEPTDSNLIYMIRKNIRNLFKR